MWVSNKDEYVDTGGILKAEYWKLMKSWTKDEEEDEEAIEKARKKRDHNRIMRLIWSDPDPTTTVKGSLVAGYEDVFFFEILIRLPFKSLTRFKSVCKCWKSVIEQDPVFINSHRARLESDPGLLIFCYPYERGDDVNSGYPSRSKFHGYALSDLHGGVVNIKRTGHCYQGILGPLRGLICLVDELAVQICHPSSGQAMTPWINSTVFMNAEELGFHKCRPQSYFGFDPDTGKHKVLHLWYRLNVTPICEVLTVGDDTRFRIIDDVPPCACKLAPCQIFSAYAKGSMYWFTYDHKSGSDEFSESLMAFDFRSEKFRMIPIPEFTRCSEEGIINPEFSCWDRLRYEYPKFFRKYSSTVSSFVIDLIEMDGCITVVHRNSQTVRLWKFDDPYNKESSIATTQHATPTASSGKDWTQVNIRLPSEITSGFAIYCLPIPGKGQLILETYVTPTCVASFYGAPFLKNVKYARFYSYDLTEKTFSRLRIRGLASIPKMCSTMSAVFIASLPPVGKKLQKTSELG